MRTEISEERERDFTNSKLGPAGINFRNPIQTGPLRVLIWICFPGGGVHFAERCDDWQGTEVQSRTLTLRCTTRV